MFYFQKRNVFSSGEQISTFQIYLVSQQNITFFEVFRPPSENVQRDELITSSSAVEGLGRARRRARWRATGARGGGARARAVEAARGRRGRRCHGRRTDGGTRKKRAAVFDEEEEERIDLRQALEVIYQGDLLPVRVTNWE